MAQPFIVFVWDGTTYTPQENGSEPQGFQYVGGRWSRFHWPSWNDPENDTYRQATLAWAIESQHVTTVTSTHQTSGTTKQDKEELEEVEGGPVVMSEKAAKEHLPSGDATEVDGVELYMVLGRIRAAYTTGDFSSTRPTFFMNSRSILPSKPYGYYQEFAEKKQSHWRVVVGWDEKNPETLELYFNSGRRSNKHYGDEDWWRYNPSRNEWFPCGKK